jgi:hypothetical protein
VQRGGFGKSTSAISRGVYRQVAPLPTPQELLQIQYLASVVPDPRRAMDYLVHDRNSLQEYSGLAFHLAKSDMTAVQERQRDLEVYGINSDDRTAENTDTAGELGRATDENKPTSATSAAAGSNLPAPFKQETHVLFVRAAEYLRHFYALLNRTGDDAPMPGNATYMKIEKLLELLDLTNQKLLGKKTRFKNDASLSGEQRDGQIKVVDELMRLLTRGRAVWATYVKKF